MSRRLRDHTRAAHRRAERTGVIGGIITGRISIGAYVLFLRNLLPVYTIMEQRLARCHAGDCVRALARPAVYRSRALTNDLDALTVKDWRETVPLLPSGENYRERIARASDEQLFAHAYVRYLGDLSGGRILQRILRDELGISPSKLAFYDFPDIADIGAFKASFREAIDLVAEKVDIPILLEEARVAFELNITLSEEVLTYSGSMIEAHR